ncbi:MAG: hypothetical protein IPK17_19095 [Chloroflexi bacterium]|uniref:hypothetical protein n=1 Tax=Candidatus Flexifilum breve TaxID=3140694 RepID=UPI003134F90C|nr:hypothetical protein [Chloroflexota bacterium]
MIDIGYGLDHVHARAGAWQNLGITQVATLARSRRFPDGQQIKARRPTDLPIGANERTRVPTSPRRQ